MFPGSLRNAQAPGNAGWLRLRSRGHVLEGWRENRRLLPAPPCPQLTSHSRLSPPPAQAAPRFSCWTVAVFQHQTLGTVPFSSWLDCVQTGNSGAVRAVSLFWATTPLGWRLSRRTPRFQKPVPAKAASSRLAEAPPRFPGRSESTCKETLRGPRVITGPLWEQEGYRGEGLGGLKVL